MLFKSWKWNKQALTKWPLFWRWHFQMHFLIQKLLYFDLNFIEVHSRNICFCHLSPWICHYIYCKTLFRSQLHDIIKHWTRKYFLQNTQAWGSFCLFIKYSVIQISIDHGTMVTQQFAIWLIQLYIEYNATNVRLISIEITISSSIWKENI